MSDIDLDKEELGRRYMLLRTAVRHHRSQKADDRCIKDHKELYLALEDGIEADFHIGDPEAMLANCKRFIAQECLPGKWPTYADLESIVQGLLELNRDSNPFLSIAVDNLINRARHLYEKAAGNLRVGLPPVQSMDRSKELQWPSPTTSE